MRATVLALLLAIAPAACKRSAPASLADDASAGAATLDASTAARRGWDDAPHMPLAYASMRSLPPLEVPGLDKLAHKPLFVLREPDPWALVSDADVPSVVLYEDGLLLVAARDGQLEGHVAPADAKTFVDEVLRAGFGELAATYDCSIATDQPTVTLLVRDGTRWKISSAYGANRRGPELAAPPPAFVAAYRKAIALRSPDARPWAPEKIELMLWGNPSRSSADDWPEGVPKPPHGFGGDAGFYAHVVDGRHEARMRAFLDGPPKRNTVLVDGRATWIDLRRKIPADDYLFRVSRCIWKSAFDAGMPADCLR